MARDHGRIYSRIWDDRDFLALDQAPQRFYFFLLTQKNLSKAGILPVTLKRWAASAADLTTGDLIRLLSELDRTRFIVWDDESEELLIRTFVRGDEVYKLPNVMQAMVKDAAEIMSPKIRRALLAELDRIPLDEVKGEPTKSGGPSARETVTGCIEALRQILFVPEPTPDPNGRGTLPGRDAGTLPGTLPGTDARPLEGTVLPRDAGTLPGDLTRSGHALEVTMQANDPQGTLPGTLPASIPEPFPEGSRARACAFPQEPDPSANPSPPAGGDSSPRQQPHLAIIEGGAGTVAETDENKPEPTTTDELIADWIEHMPKRPPGQVIARVGKHIKAMLAEGIDPADVRAGIAAWARKGKDPSVLPSIVNEVMNAAPSWAAPARPRPSTTDAAVAAGDLALAEARRMRGTA